MQVIRDALGGAALDFRGKRIISKRVRLTRVEHSAFLIRFAGLRAQLIGTVLEVMQSP